MGLNITNFWGHLKFLRFTGLCNFALMIANRKLRFFLSKKSKLVFKSPYEDIINKESVENKMLYLLCT